MATITFDKVRKVYPLPSHPASLFHRRKEKDEGEVVAVKDFSMEIKDNEFVVLVGPSGCGKSTTLRMIAGLEDITSGSLYIDGVLVNDVEPKDRDTAMVFQNYALYPHMSVYDNMAFAIRKRNKDKDQVDKAVREAAEILGLTHFLDRKPKELSGGQRQRVAIGRAIVRKPKVMLMDEPLSNLDAKLRNQMRSEILSLRKRINATFVYVTHDQTEAMTLGDRIVVMKDGEVQQIGTPDEIFSFPRNLFVATFIGTPEMNIIVGDAVKDDGKWFLLLGSRRFPLGNCFSSFLEGKGGNIIRVKVGIRPEDVKINTKEDTFHGSVLVSERLGSSISLHMEWNGREVVALTEEKDENHEAKVFERDEKVSFSFSVEDIHLFDATTGNNLLWEENNG